MATSELLSLAACNDSRLFGNVPTAADHYWWWSIDRLLALGGLVLVGPFPVIVL